MVETWNGYISYLFFFVAKVLGKDLVLDRTVEVPHTPQMCQWSTCVKRTLFKVSETGNSRIDILFLFLLKQFYLLLYGPDMSFLAHHLSCSLPESHLAHGEVY